MKTKEFCKCKSYWCACPESITNLNRHIAHHVRKSVMDYVSHAHKTKHILMFNTVEIYY